MLPNALHLTEALNLYQKFGEGKRSGGRGEENRLERKRKQPKFGRLSGKVCYTQSLTPEVTHRKSLNA